LQFPVAFGAGKEKAKKTEAPAAELYKPKFAQIKCAELDALLAKPDQLLIIDLMRPDKVSTVGGFSVYPSIPGDNHGAWFCVYSKRQNPCYGIES